MESDQYKYQSIIEGFSKQNILVLGDIILDAYFWGKTDRMSPEAPVPIFEVINKNFNPGGAANVTLNIAGLGGKVSLMGVVGNDSNGKLLTDQFQKNKIDISKLIILDKYLTPIKTRVFAQDQQVIRIDEEKNNLNSQYIFEKITPLFSQNLNNYDGIILADYNKVFFTKDVIKFILSEAKKHKIPVYVDPKYDNFFEFKGVRFFKPNTVEFTTAMGIELSDTEFLKNGYHLQEKLNVEILLVTHGADGATLFAKSKHTKIPTKTQSVHDVSGAGDTVIATFALADLTGASPIDSARLANITAGIVCSKVGVVPILQADLINLLNSNN